MKNFCIAPSRPESSVATSPTGRARRSVSSTWMIGKGDLVLGEVLARPSRRATCARSWVQTNVSVTAADDALLEPVDELVPDGPGIALVDRVLRLALDRAHAVAQVVLHVGDEVGDTVVQRRSATARRSGAARRPGPSWPQAAPPSRACFSGSAARSARSRSQPHVLGRWTAGRGGGAPLQQLGAGPRCRCGGRRRARGSPDSALSSASEARPAASRRCEETGNSGMSGSICVEVRPVELRDLPPLRVQVGLGQHAGDVRRDAHARGGGTGSRARCTPARRRRRSSIGVRRRQRGERRQRVGRVRPPTPGESMRERPLCRSFRGRSTSAPVDLAVAIGRRTLRHVVGELARRRPRSRSHLAAGSIVPAARSLREHERRRVARRSARSVGTAVAMSSSTGHTGALTSALISWLLPCLNSPTTMTRMLGSSRRRFVCSSRRGGRRGLRCPRGRCPGPRVRRVVASMRSPFAADSIQADTRGSARHGGFRAGPSRCRV